PIVLPVSSESRVEGDRNRNRMCGYPCSKGGQGNKSVKSSPLLFFFFRVSSIELHQVLAGASCRNRRFLRQVAQGNGSSHGAKGHFEKDFGVVREPTPSPVSPSDDLVRRLTELQLCRPQDFQRARGSV